MKSIKYRFLVMAIITLIGLISSCGIFKKGCDCPKFGKTNSKGQVVRTV